MRALTVNVPVRGEREVIPPATARLISAGSVTQRVLKRAQCVRCRQWQRRKVDYGDDRRSGANRKCEGQDRD
jgi:hypothetical protein